MRLTVLSVALLTALLSGCGNDKASPANEKDDTTDSTTAVTVAKADLVACLTDAGLEATDSAVEYPEELKERDRIVETVDIAGTGELTGLGSATWFEDADAAVAGNEAAGLVSTDEVRRGVSGRIAWRWAGEGPAADAIEECLAG